MNPLVIVRAGSRPVCVNLNMNQSGPLERGYTGREFFMSPGEERSFSVSGDGSIGVNVLPEGMTSFYDQRPPEPDSTSNSLASVADVGKVEPAEEQGWEDAFQKQRGRDPDAYKRDNDETAGDGEDADHGTHQLG